MKRAAAIAAFCVLAMLVASADARPGTSKSAVSSHPSSTYHYNGSHGGSSSLDTGSIIAILLGAGIFAAVVVALRRRREVGSTVHVTNVPPSSLDFGPVRAAIPGFSRVAFEETAADLVRGELAKRTNASASSVLVADIRPTHVDAHQIVCTIETSANGVYNVGRWTFTRTGDASWQIAKHEDISLGRGPQLVGGGPEVGNDLPTLTDEQAIVRFSQLRDEDTATSWDSFVARVRDTYTHLNDAWNKQDLAGVEGYVTRRLVEWIRFWYGEYQRQGLVNHHADAEMNHVGLAQVTREPQVDVVTVRVYARGFDFTTKAGSTELASGSQTTKREYTEYWTFTRAKGSTSWLLHKIEQDELYSG